ncbi:MAG: cytochrome c oxidase subunit II [Nocardioides sp.]
MGLQLPERRAGFGAVRRRMSILALSGTSLVALAGCSSDDSSDWERLAMPDPGTVEGESVLSLWQGAWIAALITGVFVWGLIFYAAWRFRRRSDDEVPVQTRYNLPLEIFYTIFPIIMVVVFFSHTVRVQNEILDDSPPDNTITVVGQQWTWTFNHPYDGENVWEGGDGNRIPTLVLPVDETTRFELRTPDVIHSFGIPGFVMKMDVMPGQENHFQVTPKEIGDYRGNCYELCGVYHSRMLFNVEVVSRADYDAYLQELEDAGHVTDEPIIGGSYADEQVGIEEGEAE